MTKPIIPTNAGVLSTLTDYVFVPLAIMAVFFLICLLMLNRMEKAYNIQKKKLWLLFATLAGIAVILTSGISLLAVKGLLLCLILVFASIADIDRREVPDFVPLMILLTAFIGFEIENLPGMIIGAAAVFVPQLAIAMLKPGTYGGADIKITTALAFLLGAERGVFGIVLGLAIAVIVMVILQNAKKLPRNTFFPLVPFFAVGGIIAYLI